MTVPRAPASPLSRAGPGRGCLGAPAELGGVCGLSVGIHRGFCSCISKRLQEIPEQVASTQHGDGRGCWGDLPTPGTPPLPTAALTLPAQSMLRASSGFSQSSWMMGAVSPANISTALLLNPPSPGAAGIFPSRSTVPLLGGTQNPSYHVTIDLFPHVDF